MSIACFKIRKWRATFIRQSNSCRWMWLVQSVFERALVVGRLTVWYRGFSHVNWCEKFQAWIWCEIFHTWNRCEISIRHVQPCSTCEISNLHTFQTCFWCELGMKQAWSYENILYGLVLQDGRLGNKLLSVSDQVLMQKPTEKLHKDATNSSITHRLWADIERSFGSDNSRKIGVVNPVYWSYPYSRHQSYNQNDTHDTTTIGSAWLAIYMYHMIPTIHGSTRSRNASMENQRNPQREDVNSSTSNRFMFVKSPFIYKFLGK